MTVLFARLTPFACAGGRTVLSAALAPRAAAGRLRLADATAALALPRPPGCGRDLGPTT